LILEPLDGYGMLAIRFGVLERIYITSIAHSSIHIHSLDTGKKCLDFVWFQREKKRVMYRKTKDAVHGYRDKAWQM
jgi:hypothetical protein